MAAIRTVDSVVLMMVVGIAVAVARVTMSLDSRPGPAGTLVGPRIQVYRSVGRRMGPWIGGRCGWFVAYSYGGRNGLSVRLHSWSILPRRNPEVAVVLPTRGEDCPAHQSSPSIGSRALGGRLVVRRRFGRRTGGVVGAG